MGAVNIEIEKLRDRSVGQSVSFGVFRWFLAIKHVLPLYLAGLLEEARFTKSQFGKAILVDADGYRYSHSRMNDKRVYWRCVYYMKNRGSCPGKAVTEGFFIRQKSGGHLHKPLEPIVRRPHGNSSQAKKPQQELPQQQQQQQPQQIHELNTMQQLHHAY